MGFWSTSGPALLALALPALTALNGVRFAPGLGFAALPASFGGAAFSTSAAKAGAEAGVRAFRADADADGGALSSCRWAFSCSRASRSRRLTMRCWNLARLPSSRARGAARRCTPSSYTASASACRRVFSRCSACAS